MLIRRVVSSGWPGRRGRSGGGSPSSGGGIVTPDIAFSNFSSGALGPTFTTPWPADVTVINNPTGSLPAAKVAQPHYVDSGSIIDSNRAFYLAGGVVDVLPSHYFVAFDLYFPVGIFNYFNNAIERKLVYFRDSTQSYRTMVMFIWADQLGYVIETASDLVSRQRLGIATLTPGAWHEIEFEIQWNTSGSASNGLFRVWLDRVLTSEQLNIKLFEAGTAGYGEFMGFGYQREGGTSKDPSDTACDEVRYITNVGFSTQRIRP